MGNLGEVDRGFCLGDFFWGWGFVGRELDDGVGGVGILGKELGIWGWFLEILLLFLNFNKNLVLVKYLVKLLILGLFFYFWWDIVEWRIGIIWFLCFFNIVRLIFVIFGLLLNFWFILFCVKFFVFCISIL